MTLTPEHGEYSKGKSKNYRWLYVGSAHKRECLAPQQEAGSGCMDAQFTAPFFLLHILPFPQLFSLLFFSKEISSKCLHSFQPYKSQNTLYYCTMFYMFLQSLLSFMAVLSQYSQEMKLGPWKMQKFLLKYTYFLSLKVL